MIRLADILASTENANGDSRPVEIIPTHMTRGPYQTHAERTLQNILLERGENHLRFVLATILQSENNANALVAPVIEAVSEIVATHPEWAERASDWMDVFDGFQLVEVYEHAKALKGRARGPTKAWAVFILLSDRLAAALGAPAPQKDLFS